MWLYIQLSYDDDGHDNSFGVDQKFKMVISHGQSSFWWNSLSFLREAFHPYKCSVLTITNKKNPVKHNYLLHNHTLESVSSAKYLGITLQSDLKWTQHAYNIVANANKSLGFFKRNLKTSKTNIKSQAYLSSCPSKSRVCMLNLHLGPSHCRTLQ
jgi:hypothetical protein